MMGCCKDCKFWSKGDASEWNSTGVCVRHPPVPVVAFNGGSIAIEWRQPETKTHDQCGEWKSLYNRQVASDEENRISG